MTAIVRGLLFRHLTAVVVGAMVGFIVFELTEAGGRWLFVATGAVAGVAAVIALQLYNRTARLTEVKITVPQISELTFVVNNESRTVAWKLFVETVTRISIQPLDEEEGLLREALSSLYGLFATTREILKTTRPSTPVPGGQTVEYLAITMLNLELRPFLSKWHPRLQEFEKGHPNLPESAWGENTSCRRELQAIQGNIHRYAMGFAALAGVREPEAMLVSDTRTGALGESH
ncbi:hypothetical protein IMZ11_40310 [Microtetraspora sp. AC03309]|uniref:hypothetical protein n=1 Tax=Microtetraspora sp. AC03309 TaxID=2779376 RepID=UPI001E595E7E|nr:hypothetical protein [Microtetraspora sp. AC03309]MCC5581864.1 hypothetical protein [Microtetraspora sp. AC03309]